MSNYLLEIGTEEIPARFMQGMITALQKQLADGLTGARLTFGSIKVTGTYRRLSAFVTDLADRQVDLDAKIKGPPLKVAQDADGKWTKAAEGFARKNNIQVAELYPREGYAYFKQFAAGKNTTEVLAGVVEGSISALYLPIAMKWGEGKDGFVRPVHWVLSLLGDQHLPITLKGCGSGIKTHGHRTMGSQRGAAPVSKADYHEYQGILELEGVIVDHQIRRAQISTELHQKAKVLGADLVLNEELLDEVTFLTESPYIVTGSFQPEYLEVPAEILILTMQKNQKYFPLKKQGQLIETFFIVADGDQANSKTVREGNERVLRARLADARFFYNEDKGSTLEAMNDKLKTVVYHKDIGTIYAKVERVARNAKWIAGQIGLSAEDQQTVNDLALLCKADLASRVVYEFPELQGVMGKYYYQMRIGATALQAGVMEEHWWPKQAGSALPTQVYGTVVSIADKIDSICAAFSAGLIPTGSQDPYALRRQAQGILAILLERKLSLTIGALVELGYGNLMTKDHADECVEFWRQRIRFVLLEDAEISYDVADMVLPLAMKLSILEMGDLCRAIQKEKNIKDGVFQKLCEAIVRIMRLGKGVSISKVIPSDFVMPIENELWQAYLGMQRRESDFTGNYSLLCGLIPLIDRYFIEVMVMTEDLELRTNRLAMLRSMADQFAEFGDWEKLVFTE